MGGMGGMGGGGGGVSQSSIWSAVASQAGGTWEIGLSLLGGYLAQGNYKAADEIYQQIINSLDEEDVPRFERLVAQELPQMREISMSSGGRTAQQAAISRLQQFADEGGLDDTARAQLQQSMSLEDQRSRGSREAIMQSRARRGIGGSGDELSALLSENQGSANRGRDSSLQIASDARQRALSALGQSGQLASTMRGQDIGVDKANLDAQKEREMFNAKMRMASTQGNNQNAQNDFMNRLNKQKMLSQAKGRKAERFLEGAAQTRRDWAGVGRGMNMKHQQASEDLDEMDF